MPGLPALVAAELAEIFMGAQDKGWNPGWSNGEALSRVCAQILYPNNAWLSSSGNWWLNGDPDGSNNLARSNWVDYVFQGDDLNHGDADDVSYGCGALFLNYLAYQRSKRWPDIIGAGAPWTNTLADTANALDVPNAWNEFSDLMTKYFPPGSEMSLPPQPTTFGQDPGSNGPTDNPFPLGPVPTPVTSLYIRHNLADDGTSPGGSLPDIPGIIRSLTDSPDIILKNDTVDNPQDALSITSDTESDNVLTGKPNYVYLRVWNGGAADAANVFATVYWSPPATLVSPNMWTLIGSAYYPDVTVGAVQTSNPGIIWPADQIPAPGDYCFVATVGNPSAPALNPASFNSFDDFVTYIYDNNNIAWRNFNVVNPSPQPSPGPWDVFVPLKFHIVGAWDRAHHFVFETFSDLPEESRFALQVPHWLGRGLTPVHPRLEEFEDRETDPENPRRLRIALHPHGHHSLGRIELPVGTAAASHMLVHIPPGRHQHPHKVGIRQLYEGREVGRITWLLRPKHEELQR